MEIDFDNYFLQHTDMPKNVKVSIECLEAYNSNSGDWEVVTNFGAGKNETDFRITATNLLSGMYRSSACTTLMKNMGGQPYNNVNDADDPANGKRFRVKYTNNTYNYNYYFLPYYEYYKNSSQQTKGSFLGFYFDGEVAPSGQESFWVIKIAAAQRDPNDLVAEGRVFCEDMGANDFDFNDVVFDAWIYGDGRIKIEILAHGGVLDIKVADRLVTLNQMTNTGLNEQDSYSYFVPAEEAKEKGWTSIAAIPVQVVPDKNANNDYDLTAQIGQAPQKVCVPINTEWPDEYVRLDKAYTPFSSYVNICNPADWTYEVVPFLVDGLLSNNN